MVLLVDGGLRGYKLRFLELRGIVQRSAFERMDLTRNGAVTDYI